MPEFYSRLEKYAETLSRDRRAAIETELWDRFGVEEAVFILDLSGFSRTAGTHGIVHCLSMIQRMRTAIEPLVDDFGGAVVKFEADNCFARFPDPMDAIRAAIACNRRLAVVNATAEKDFEIHAAIGIDFGRFLLVKGVDFYGMPVNIASKLGEDLAEPGEILVTDEVLSRIGAPSGVVSKTRTFTISGFDIHAHQILF